MNALYVTVCIPFLLVLAGFNHAHGFTTFGKTPTNPQTPPPQRHAPAKPCENHTDCWSILKTSCVAEFKGAGKKSCLCGDNKPPSNGECSAAHKGPNHVCTTDDECVDAAACIPMEGSASSQDSTKVCKCVEGFQAYDNECNGAGHLLQNAITSLLLVVLCRTLY